MTQDIITIDINLTSVCNFGCRYCSEGHRMDYLSDARIQNSKTKVKFNDFIKFIDNLPTNRVHIGFWGGEPFLNYQYALDIMNHYCNDPKKTFMFYTNGYYIKRNLKSLIQLNNKLNEYPSTDEYKRLFIQVSYDGRKANDIDRVTKSGQSTSDIAKGALDLLKQAGIHTNFKSTISPRTFKYMFECFKEIVEEYGGSHYFPTPDMFSEYPENFEKDLETSLTLIAKYIYDHNLPPDTFKWFSNSRALCLAGINYFAIDLTGELSPCHSTMYDLCDDHVISNINDIDINEKIEQASTRYAEYRKTMYDQCVGCNVLYCMKCPAGNYGLSKDSDYKSKWTNVNPYSCKVFKINDNIHKALLKAKSIKPRPEPD